MRLTLKEMDFSEDEKAKLLVIKFMEKIGAELEIDLVTAMKTDFALNIDKEDG